MWKVKSFGMWKYLLSKLKRIRTIHRYTMFQANRFRKLSNDLLDWKLLRLIIVWYHYHNLSYFPNARMVFFIQYGNRRLNFAYDLQINRFYIEEIKFWNLHFNSGNAFYKNQQNRSLLMSCDQGKIFCRLIYFI